MNREQTEKFRDKQLIQKYNLIHLLPTLNVPELSGLYLKSFLNATKRYQLQLPPLINDSSSKFCGSCGAVRIPRFNVEMSTVEHNKTTADEPPRVLQYKCLNCSYTETFPLESQSRNQIKLQTKDQGFVATWPQEKQQEKVTNKVEKKTSAKDRAKKRKLNSLSNLLSKKNEEKKKQNSPSLSLESFMQQG